MNHRSIEFRLPAFIGALLVAAVFASVWGAYQEVKHSALLAASDRLDRVTTQVAELVQTGIRQQLGALHAVARDPAVGAYLGRAAGPQARSAVLRALNRRVTTGQGPVAVELWDASGRVVVAAGAAPPPLDTGAARDLMAAARGRDSGAPGPLQLARDTLWFASVVAVPAGPRGGGYLVERRHVSTNPDAARQLGSLIGSDAALYIGNARGDLWTDFWKPVDPPPVDLSGRKGTVQYERRGIAQLARAVPVAATPWMILVEFSRDAVLGRADAFLSRATLFAVLLLALGATATWAISRAITHPLRQLTDAAAAIADGDYARRVDLVRADELGRLAQAFNVMARHVGDSQHTLEHEVAARTRELRAAVGELEAFSYSVSHDLRAPVRAVGGFARILVEDHGPALDPEAQRLLGIIRDNAARMGELIDDLLDFARLNREPLTTVPLDLEALAHSVVDQLRKETAAPPPHVVIGPLPPAHGDRGLMRQVLVNLIGNAVKFTRGRENARVEIGARQDNGETVYYVRDNGVGFDMHYAGKLFGVFQRLHRADEFEGTGVGLALVQRIIQRHGGRVWAEGRVNEGATFSFTLPHQRWAG
ncbi:MAG TPA: ATP-binding protein [Gemmatimonadales bacterium]|nr:ATP-binding protein [Gemmatimonadales bacterium]